MQRRSAALGVLSALLAAGTMLAPGLAGIAGAANGGAGAPDVPASNSGGSPGGQSILCTVTAPPAGGTQTCGGVTVTDGSTSGGLSISFSTRAGPSCAVAPALTVSFVDGTTHQGLSGALSPAVAISYANAAIVAGETVLAYDGASGGWVLPPSGAVVSASASTGVVHASFTANGSIAVEGSTCGSAIAGATTAVTGKPFLGEGLVAMVLVLGGGLALAVVVRRRRPADIG